LTSFIPLPVAQWHALPKGLLPSARLHRCGPPERHCTLSDQDIGDFLKSKAKSKTLNCIDVLLLTKVGFSRDGMNLLKVII
jgi:hypothetical protein